MTAAEFDALVAQIETNFDKPYCPLPSWASAADIQAAFSIVTARRREWIGYRYRCCE